MEQKEGIEDIETRLMDLLSASRSGGSSNTRKAALSK